jgi:site-specific DNA recombinase
LLDTAVLHALVDFYTRTDVITAAVAAEAALRAADAHRHTTEMDAITTQITKTEAAIDRYLTTFENATLDERTCAHRVRDLALRRENLTARRDQLRELANTTLDLPSPATIKQLRQDLAHVLDHGTPGQRKAIIESHVAEIKIEDGQLIPIFKIPAEYDERPADEPADREPDTTFRTMVHVVDMRLRHTNTPAVAIGPNLRLPVARERQVRPS